MDSKAIAARDAAKEARRQAERDQLAAERARREAEKADQRLRDAQAAHKRARQAAEAARRDADRAEEIVRRAREAMAAAQRGSGHRRSSGPLASRLGKFHTSDESDLSDTVRTTPVDQLPTNRPAGPPPATIPEFKDFVAGLDHRLWHFADFDNERGYHNNCEIGTNDQAYHVQGMLPSAASLNAIVPAVPGSPLSGASFQADINAYRAILGRGAFNDFAAIHAAFHLAAQHIHGHSDQGHCINPPRPPGNIDGLLGAQHQGLHNAQAGGAAALETWFHSNFCAGAGSVGNQDLEALHDLWHHLIGIPDSGLCIDGVPPPPPPPPPGGSVAPQAFGDLYLALDHSLWHQGHGSDESYHDPLPSGAPVHFIPPVDEGTREFLIGAYTEEGFPDPFHPSPAFDGFFSVQSFGADDDSFRNLFTASNTDFRSTPTLRALLRFVLHHAHLHDHAVDDPGSNVGHLELADFASSFDRAAQSGNRNDLETWFHTNMCAALSGQLDLLALHERWHVLTGLPESGPCNSNGGTAADFGNLYAGLDHRLWNVDLPPFFPYDFPQNIPQDLGSANDATGHVIGTWAEHSPDDFDLAGGLSTPDRFFGDMAALSQLFLNPSPDFGTFDSIHAAFHVAMQHVHAHAHTFGASMDDKLVAIHTALHASKIGGRIGLENWFHSNFCSGAGPALDQDLEALHDTWHRLLGVPKDAPGMTAT